MKNVYLYISMIAISLGMSIILYNSLLYYSVDNLIMNVSVTKLISLLLIIILLPNFIMNMKYKELIPANLLCLYFLFHNFFCQDSLNDFLTTSANSIGFLLIFVFSYSIGKYKNLQSKFLILYLGFNILFFLLFLYNSSLFSFNSNDWIFSIVALLPICLFINKKVLQFFLILCILLFVLFSLKRSVVLASLLFVLIYMKSQGKLSISLKNLLFIILLLFIIIVVLHSFGDYVTRLLERFNELGQDEGSGRKDIYSLLLDKYNFLTVSCQLFGLGQGAVFKDMYIYAHNDFLELLYDYGLIGVSLFVYFLIYLCVRFCFYSKKMKNNIDSHIFKSTLILYMFLGVFNCVIYNVNVIVPLFLILGLTFGNLVRNYK